jgi:hypothetical protein
MRRRIFGVLFVCLGLILGAGSAHAVAPFGGWLVLPGNTTSGATGHGYLEVPHSAALNPTPGFTFEAWVKLAPNGSSGCRSIAGKGWTVAWWVGICDNLLRSYLRGSGSSFTAGYIPDGEWTHIAVVGTGSAVYHYINGTLVAYRSEPSAPTTSTAVFRIGSDVSWNYSPSGAIEEARLWNVARSEAQIQSAKNIAITTPQAGLVGVWSLNGNAQDVVGPYDGTLQGTYSFATNDPPAGAWITSSSVPGFQFKVRITSGANVITGAKENSCIPETVCVSGALPGRSEVFLRVIGPRPNGYLWPTIVRFTVSEVEVWVQKINTGQTNYYHLGAVPTDSDELVGFVDRLGFLP